MSTVLISIQQPVVAWQIPEAEVARLRHAFPHITFLYATDADARARGLEMCDIAYTWILSPDELVRAPQLKWVHTSAVAVETLCLPELFARGVLVSNTRGVQAKPIAEHVLACVLALAKQLPFVFEQQRQARWAQNDFAGDRLPWLLRGRTLGLIGVGTIGEEIARLATAFGMHVIATRRRPDLGQSTHVAEVLPTSSLDILLQRSDVLVIAAPLTPETEELIGADEIARLKPGAVLVNVGRARILQTDALIEALRSGHLSGAALDVFPKEPLPPDHPLWTCPNVILTPHTSGFRQGHWGDALDLFAENLRRFEQGGQLRFRVMPDLGY